MKTQLLYVLSLLSLTDCSSDPMQQKYTHEKGMDPVVNADPAIDPRVVSDIWEAKNYNDRHGIMNAGKTFAELADTGIGIAFDSPARNDHKSTGYLVHCSGSQRDTKR